MGDRDKDMKTVTSHNLRSREGWIIFISNIHEEAEESSIIDLCAEYCTIRNYSINLDRRTGFLKGYGFIETETYKEAQKLINNLQGYEYLDRKLNADFAFVKSPRSQSASSSQTT